MIEDAAEDAAQRAEAAASLGPATLEVRVRSVPQRGLSVRRYFTEMCSGSEEGSYLRLNRLCVSLNSRLETNKEERR